MNRKFYRMVAEAIAEERHDAGNFDGFEKTNRVYVLDRLARDLARRFEKDNPYFNRRLFLEASGTVPPPDNGNQGNAEL